LLKPDYYLIVKVAVKSAFPLVINV